MKCISALLALCICLFCLSGCGAPPALTENFKAVFSVSQDDISCKGTVSLSSEGLSIEMLEPYTVSGVRFDYSENSMSISCSDLSTKANCDYIPAGAIPSVLHNTFAYIRQAEFRRKEGDTDIYAVMTPYGEATIKAADGIPTALEDPYSGLCFEFISDS